jgi:hypothetical protein
MQAATIAQGAPMRIRARCAGIMSKKHCSSGVIDSRPGEARERRRADLVSNYGFKRLPVNDPFAAPVGSVLVYASPAPLVMSRSASDGFVSDLFKNAMPRPLLGVYAKLYLPPTRNDRQSTELFARTPNCEQMNTSPQAV